MEIKSSNGEANGEAKSSNAAAAAPESGSSGSSTPTEPSTNTEPSTEPITDTTSIWYALINSSGICLSCQDADATDTALPCLICCRSFHAVCRDAKGDKSGINVICTRSFYKSYHAAISGATSKSRPGNFTFLCNGCLSDHEKKKCTAQESKVDAIDKRVCSLTQSMDEMKQLLNKVVSTNIANSQRPVPQSVPTTQSYASVTTPKRTVLIVDDGLPDESSAIVEKLITDNSIHLEKSYKNENGSRVFVLPTEADRKNLSEKLTANFASIKLHQPLEKLPTISVANLPRLYEEEELKKLILLAHPDIKSLIDTGTETLKVLKVKKQLKSEDKFQASVRVSNSIRSIIAGQNDRLYIGPYSCRVFDHFFVKRCNNCQKFGHFKDQCKARSPVCGHCSGNHSTNSCEFVKKEGFHPCCNNCKASTFDSDKYTHTTSSHACPSYVAEQNKLRKSMSYYDSKN